MRDVHCGPRCKQTQRRSVIIEFAMITPIKRQFQCVGVAWGIMGMNPPLAVRKINIEKKTKSALVIALWSSDIKIISKISFEHTNTPSDHPPTSWVLKSTKNRKVPGLRPRPKCGSLQCSSSPLAGGMGRPASQEPHPSGPTRLAASALRTSTWHPQILNQIYVTVVNECWPMTRQFLANSRSRSLYAIARPSVCRLSSVTLVCRSNFRQYFYGIRYLGHPLCMVHIHSTTTENRWGKKKEERKRNHIMAT